MKKIFKTITTIAATLCAVATFTACEQANTCNYDEASNTLSCPDKVYKTVKIANKIWTAENMAVYVPDSSSCYDNNHANCESTGRLYTWNAANNNLCPTGWTLPTLEDYKAAFADKNADALKDAAGFTPASSTTTANSPTRMPAQVSGPATSMTIPGLILHASPTPSRLSNITTRISSPLSAALRNNSEFKNQN